MLNAPYTERYVRCGERTGANHSLLLDYFICRRVNDKKNSFYALLFFSKYNAKPYKRKIGELYMIAPAYVTPLDVRSFKDREAGRSSVSCRRINGCSTRFQTSAKQRRNNIHRAGNNCGRIIRT